jgi:2'-5' RNA ligase
VRLFIAINLPATEKQRLSDILAPLRAYDAPVRWVDPDSLHVTLKFLGEVADNDVPSVEAAMLQAADRSQRFKMRLGGFGAFPSMSGARVFWLGVDASPLLFELQANVEESCAPLGFLPEKRAFSPHLTLGRVRKNSHVGRGDADRFAAEAVYNAVVAVDSLELMRSHLSPRGARYEVLESARLLK